MKIKHSLKVIYYTLLNKCSREEPRGQELINRYRENYGIPKEIDLTEENILEHWHLELQLTKLLLESTPDNRWEVFEKCYTTLYTKLEWLNKLIDKRAPLPPNILYKEWAYLIGTAPKRIYEIGSGRAEMISYLADLGHEIKATEITREQGEKHTSDKLENLKWGISDGVHLEQFEPVNTYDFVISNQVIEHMHPDDLPENCKHVYSTLKSGGKYIVCAPHPWHGPPDISAVFKYKKAIGVHLKEYTNYQIYSHLKRSGFKKVSSTFRPPKFFIDLFSIKDTPKTSVFFTIYLFAIERVFHLFSRMLVGNKIKSFAKKLLFSENTSLIAQKISPKTYRFIDI
ncbi:SAM-dependent methyltransferase [Methylomonas sp. MK1]|uniref:SAM-dependent methyltransferase n=1 Tax=Methylomonas sp. MK1 TaxID=1131552 RepID=UPI00036FE864|nr:class I SAM-dependent methyltransferase [Methylomonas sp. MK1]